jgi:hypothetical protein
MRKLFDEIDTLCAFGEFGKTSETKYLSVGHWRIRHEVQNKLHELALYLPTYIYL